MASESYHNSNSSVGFRNSVEFTGIDDQEDASGNAIDRPEPDAPTLAQMWTAVTLVSGTAVGAGILAIASVSLKSGFVPSSLTLLGCWGLMALVGFAIAEITCNIAFRDANAKDFGLLSITERLWGHKAGRVIGLVYVLFHYTLLIAYIAGAGEIISNVAQMPRAAGPVLFTVVMGGFIAVCRQEAVDMLNNCLFIVVVIAFLTLASLGAGSVNAGNLSYQDYSAVGPTVPILLISLVFHNIVPTICSTLQYHRRSICTAIIIGSLIPLAMFILWNAVILGIVRDYSTVAHQDKPIDPVQTLLDLNPTHNKAFGEALITIFSEAAIITSFIGFVTALMEFLADMFPGRSKRDGCLYALVLVPPMLVALGNPGIFLSALDVGGAYGVTVLFGLLPLALTAKLRQDCSSGLFPYSTGPKPTRDTAGSTGSLSSAASRAGPAGGIEMSVSSNPLRRAGSGRDSGYDRLPSAGDAEETVVTFGLPSGLQGRQGVEDLEEVSRHSNEPLRGGGAIGVEGAGYVYFLPGGDYLLYAMAAAFVAIIIIKIASG